jgi:hypothetical protein
MDCTPNVMHMTPDLPKNRTDVSPLTCWLAEHNNNIPSSPLRLFSTLYESIQYAQQSNMQILDNKRK